MQQTLILMLTTGVLWTLVGIVFGRAPDDRAGLRSFFALNGMVYVLFIWLFRFPQPAEPLEVLHLSIFMLPATIVEMVGFLLLKYAMARGSQGLAWSIAQSAMIFPFLGAIAFLNNHAGALKYAGVAVLLTGLILVGKSKQRKRDDEAETNGRKGYLSFAFGAFLLIGLGQFLRIIPGNIGFSEAVLSWRLPLTAPCGMIFWTCYSLSTHTFVPGKVWKIALSYGIIVALGQICFFYAVDAADLLGITSIVYPVAVGTSILLFSVYCVTFRKEKFSLCGWFGVVLITFGIALLSVR